jgi:hypothetical protein
VHVPLIRLACVIGLTPPPLIMVNDGMSKCPFSTESWLLPDEKQFQTLLRTSTWHYDTDILFSARTPAC